jgi:hypothetical protein
MQDSVFWLLLRDARSIDGTPATGGDCVSADEVIQNVGNVDSLPPSRAQSLTSSIAPQGVLFAILEPTGAVPIVPIRTRT